MFTYTVSDNKREERCRGRAMSTKSVLELGRRPKSIEYRKGEARWEQTNSEQSALAEHACPHLDELGFVETSILVLVEHLHHPSSHGLVEPHHVPDDGHYFLWT